VALSAGLLRPTLAAQQCIYDVHLQLSYRGMLSTRTTIVIAFERDHD
jgi:hypothetical protein